MDFWKRRCQINPVLTFCKRNNFALLTIFLFPIFIVMMCMLSVFLLPALSACDMIRIQREKWRGDESWRSQNIPGVDKNAPSPSLHAEYIALEVSVYAVWKGVAFRRGPVTTERWDQFWWWFESQANIQFLKHYGSFVKWIHTDRNGPAAMVNRKNIEPVVRNILVILLPPPRSLASSSSIVIHWTHGSLSWMTSTSFAD